MAGVGTNFQRFLYRVYSRYAGISNFWRQRLTPAGWLAIVALVSAAFVGLDTNQTLAYQLFTFLAVLGLFSLVWGFFFRPRLRITRECPRFASAGVPFTYRVRLENMGRRGYRTLHLREWLGVPVPRREAFFGAHEPGESVRNRFDRKFLFYRWLWLVERARVALESDSAGFSLAGKGRAVVAMKLEPNRRGILRLDECRVLRPDPFGLLKAVRRVKPDRVETVTVLPKRYRLPQLRLAGRSRYQPSGVALAGSVGQSEEFMGLREYRPGDPMRHLHWKSWARVGKPIVMEFENEFFPRYALALDTFADFDHDSVFEEAVSVAASFVCTLDTKESLLDLMFVGAEAYCFTSGRGTSQPERLLEILASAGLCSDRPFAALDNLIASHMRELSACICVLIDWDDARRECVNRLRAQGIEVMVIVICADDDPRVEDPGGEGVHFMGANGVAEGLMRL